MRRGLLLATAILGAALFHCHATTAQPIDTWMQRLTALKCYPRFDFDAASLDPLLFAMINSCRRVRRGDEPFGPYSLIALDASRDELRTVNISAFRSGGIHHTRAGEIVWFSELNQALLGQEQRFIDAFALAPGASSERWLGRIELPFIAGYVDIVKGSDCHVLGIRSMPDGTLPERRLLMFDDGDPIGSSKSLTGVYRVLYFEPRRKAFVVERATAEAESGRPDRALLDCAARLAPLDESLAAQLARVESRDAQYWPAASGDLLVQDPLPDDGLGGQRTLVFHGTKLTTFTPVIRCYKVLPDWCYRISVSPRSWSSSGEHFVLVQPGALWEFYRTSDLSVVYERPVDLNGTFLYIDDDALHFVTSRGRFRRDAWR
jgi:hypothetical protein